MPTQRLKMIWLLLMMVVTLSTAAAQNMPKGQVVVALGSDLSALDPHMHNIRGMLIVGWQLFDSLISRDATTMKPVPHLAESWRLVDELTWELRLRQGVKFHNGEPFNAATVQYNFERVLNPEQKSPQRGNIAWLSRVHVVDEYTVRGASQADPQGL
jgi:peptide/nickel transport system substrate-binding protein